ncbi:cilia- and flagella-associated protein 251-like [Helianthus annuus]|uniref:cilia- and flagella-associated protein 251-like n=1 Tax=Helianthus annuus TaxID=4232 RepID=UPI000B8F540F|nr:cilia- and flagella-associated protein 251-like [Helianthus annuus]
MKEAAYADELKTLEEFKPTRNDWFVKETRRRRRKVTPKVKEGEGSSSQPKKKQKKVAKTLLVDEPEEEEPAVNVEENPYAGIEEVMLDLDDLEVEQTAQAVNVEAQKEKVIDDIEGDDVDKDTTSSSSSSEDEVDEAERLRRIQEATEKEKLLRKRKRQEKEDAPFWQKEGRGKKESCISKDPESYTKDFKAEDRLKEETFQRNQETINTTT